MKFEPGEGPSPVARLISVKFIEWKRSEAPRCHMKQRRNIPSGQHVVNAFFASPAVNTAAHARPLNLLTAVPDADNDTLEFTLNPFALLLSEICWELTP